MKQEWPPLCERIWQILKRHKREVLKLHPEYCHELICAMEEIRKIREEKK